MTKKHKFGKTYMLSLLPNFYQFLVFVYQNCGEPCCNEHKNVTVLFSYCTESPNTLLLIFHAVLTYTGSHGEFTCFRF